MTSPSLHVEEAGDLDGPPVLFLHGFMSSNLQWEPNRAGLGAGLRLLLADQPGHGRSPAPDNPQAYMADAVLDQIDRIRAERDIDRWWLVGQSLGGAMLIRYAIRHPERVAGLVFTNSRAVFGLTARRPETREGTGRYSEPTREWAKGLPYHPSNAKRIPAGLKARMVEAADAMPLSVFRHMPTAGPWHSTDDLHRLQVPTLLINGRFEKAFQPCVAQARTAIQGLQVVDLDGGHSVNIDQPEAFNQAVANFIHSE